MWHLKLPFKCWVKTTTLRLWSVRSLVAQWLEFQAFNLWVQSLLGETKILQVTQGRQKKKKGMEK